MFAERNLKWFGLVIFALFGLLQAWVGRFPLILTVAYLDLSDAFRSHQWRLFLM
jgi:hypothetical protein